MIALERPSEELLAQTPPVVLVYLEALESVVTSLQARLGEVEARLGQDSRTSSRPPSSDPPKPQAQRRAPPPPAAGEEAERRRPGGQPGQPGHHPSIPQDALVEAARVDPSMPQDVVVVTPASCRGRGTALTPEPRASDPAVERVQQVELPPVRAVVTEYQRAARQCRACGVVTRAARPGEAGTGSFGPRLPGVATLFVGRYPSLHSGP